MALQTHPFLLHLVHSGEFSDFTLRCKDRDFKLHQVIVCPQSPVISAALHSGFEETSSKVLIVNEFDIATVQSMVTFLYTGDYDLAPETEKPAEVQDSQSHSDQDRMPHDSSESEDTGEKTAEKILSHIRVNAIADYYNIEKLANHSTSKICTILQGALDLKLLPKIIEEASTTTRDAGLRSAIAEVTARYIEGLASSQILQSLDLEQNLAIGILEECGKRIQGLLEDLNAARDLTEIEKRIAERQRREKSIVIAKLMNTVDTLTRYKQCRHCSKVFGCFFRKAPEPITNGNPYELICSECSASH